MSIALTILFVIIGIHNYFKKPPYAAYNTAPIHNTNPMPDSVVFLIVFTVIFAIIFTIKHLKSED